jgi:hypothetical protein
MKTWKQITFISVLTILSVVATACTRSEASSTRSGVASNGAPPQTQAQAVSETPAAQTDSAPANHEEIAGSPVSLITKGSHTEENPIWIWGWSRDGKTGISELSDSGGRGGIIIKTFIFDAVNDAVLWEHSIDSFDYGDGYSGIPENEITAFFDNFHSTCRQLFDIEVKEVRPAAPSGSAIRHNGRSYDIAVNSAEEDEDGMIRRYSVTAEAGGTSKTILSKDTFLPALPKFFRYSISPLEERALIILRWSGFFESYGFVYAGCHLTVGF